MLDHSVGTRVTCRGHIRTGVIQHNHVTEIQGHVWVLWDQPRYAAQIVKMERMKLTEIYPRNVPSLNEWEKVFYGEAQDTSVEEGGAEAAE